MSGFICGDIVFKRKLQLEEQIAATLRFVRCALDVDLVVQFGGAICQAKFVIEDLLGLKYQDPCLVHCPFLILEFPASVTSDQLLSAEGPDFTPEGIKKELSKKLKPVEIFLTHLVNDPLVAEVNVRIADGYAPDHRRLTFPVAEFASRVSSLCHTPSDEIPSLWINVS